MNSQVDIAKWKRHSVISFFVFAVSIILAIVLISIGFNGEKNIIMLIIGGVSGFIAICSLAYFIYASGKYESIIS